MTIDVQITCIKKGDRSDPHRAISSVGGQNPDGSRWGLTLDQAIDGIEAGTYRFWTRANATSVWVQIARSAHGHKYLKTANDGVWPNNLLALAECP